MVWKPTESRPEAAWMKAEADSKQIRHRPEADWKTGKSKIALFGRNIPFL